jgi:hypothetical protein
MKTVVTILLIFLSAPNVSSQELSIMRSPDTLTLRRLVFPEPEVSLWRTPSLPPINPADSAGMANLSPGFLRSEMLSDPMSYQGGFDLASSLKLQWQKEDRYKLLRAALGYIQVGGEAYLLYRAIKKYHYIH